MGKSITKAKGKKKIERTKVPVIDARPKKGIVVVEHRVSGTGYTEYAMSCINTLADENKRVQELFYQDNEILKIQQRTFGQLFRKFIESELKKM